MTSALLIYSAFPPVPLMRNRPSLTERILTDSGCCPLAVIISSAVRDVVATIIDRTRRRIVFPLGLFDQAAKVTRLKGDGR